MHADVIVNQRYRKKEAFIALLHISLKRTDTVRKVPRFNKVVLCWLHSFGACARLAEGKDLSRH